MWKVLDWFTRLRQQRVDSHSLYSEKHEWVIAGITSSRQLEVVTPPMTRVQAIEYVKVTLGLHVGIVDDELHYILCEHPKARRISDG